jgi:glycosyltransferase involved in cell wall biosynthesis
MRILHISTRLILGGSQENTVLSCEGQARRGHEVHLAFGPIYGPEGSLLERVQNFRTGDGRSIGTHIVPHMIREVSPRADWLASRELRALIRTLGPDIVHTHSSKAGILGRAAAWACLAQRRKNDARNGIVHTVHGPPFMPIEGSAVAQAKTRANNTIYTLAERYAAKRCHAIVSVADAMTRQFLARGIGTPEQYTTVYSGMEVEQYLTPAPGQSREEMRRRLGLADNDIVVGTVARLAQHKGHDDLLEALAGDLRARPNLKLLWVGDGWWRQRLIAKARGMGLKVAELDGTIDGATEQRSDEGEAPHPHSHHRPHSQPPHLILTGLVPPSAIPGHVRAMDILAHPSYREGLPRTIPQALLCGTAPVAYDIDGTGEVCRDGETGRLIGRAGDLPALRRAILDLADNAPERHRLAAAGREWCRERFSAGTMVEDLDRVYARALEISRA